MKAQIIRIFFIIAVSVFCPAGIYADVTVVSNIRLRNDVSGRDADFLRNAVKQLERLRRLSDGKKRASRRELVISAGAEEFVFNGGYLQLPGDALRWESDADLRRQIYGVLVANRFELDYPRRGGALPLWVVSGLDNGIISAETAGQYVAGNSSYALLSSICPDGVTLPDFGALCRLRYPVMAVADEFAAEQSRLLLEIFARNGRLRELFAGFFAGKPGDFWLNWYASPADAQRFLQQDAGKLLFDRFNSMPAGAAAELVTELETFYIPERGVDGKPTGKVIDGNISTFCTILQGERSDADLLRREAAGQWRQLGRNLALKEREICRQAARLMLRAGLDDDVPERFANAVTELKKALQIRQKQAAFLNQVLDRTVPPMLRYRVILRAAEYDENVLSRRHLEFFNRTLDNYLR